jgi:hypothetical protein
MTTATRAGTYSWYTPCTTIFCRVRAGWRYLLERKVMKEGHVKVWQATHVYMAQGHSHMEGPSG